MRENLPLLVFSDLDGTLLDHHDYSWKAARSGLKRLKDIGAGLVLASSKTAAEVDSLRRDIGFADMPAIVENGAGILWPAQSAPSAPDDYRRIQNLLATLPEGFLGFAGMSDQDVADKTGLSLEGATKARQRAFSEPGIWSGTEEGLEHFLKMAALHGLHARRGGRFLTLSFGKTKADAMAEIVKLLQPARTIALGDAPNDMEMIEAANRGVIVANPNAPAIPTLRSETEGRVIRTAREGPVGWADAILSLTAHL